VDSPWLLRAPHVAAVSQGRLTALLHHTAHIKLR
jgi:hypothetical protein